MFNGEMPSSILIGLVPNSVYNGSLYKNSYNFQHFDLTKASLYANGKEYPTHGYELKMKEHKYADAFLDVYRGLSHFHSMTKEAYTKGSFFLFFDMDPSDGDLVTTMPNATVSGKFQFANPLPETMTLIAIASYHVKFFIDHLRNFTFTYTP